MSWVPEGRLYVAPASQLCCALQVDWHFRLRGGSITVASACAWLALLYTLRVALHKYEQRRQRRRVSPGLTSFTSH